MNFDLRLPLGLIFTLFGALLSVYGLLGDPAQYRKSLGININLHWGLVMLALGVVLLTFALRARGRNRNGTGTPPSGNP